MTLTVLNRSPILLSTTLLLCLLVGSAGSAGSARAQDADSPLYYHAPSFSPDGSRILFYSNRADRSNFDIYTLNLETGAITRLTDDPEYDGGPAFSPDGSTIAFGSQRDGNWEIYLMDADGSNERRLTNLGGAHDPAFSPDGSQIAFVRHVEESQEVFVMNADGTNIRQVTSHQANDHSPTWSSDGKRLYFASARSGSYRIHSVAPDGSDVWLVSAEAPGEHHVQPDASNDGTKLLFSAVDGNDTVMYLMSLKENRVRRVAANFSRDPASRLSPDGTQVVFLRKQGDDMAIFIANTDGTEVHRITNP